MTTRRKVGWVVLACGTFAFLAAAVLFPFFREHVTKTNYLRIKPGMTEREVVAILRRPADREIPVVYGDIGGLVTRKRWLAKRGWIHSIHVDFDSQGRVCNSGYYRWEYEGERIHPTPLDRFRDWSGF